MLLRPKVRECFRHELDLTASCRNAKLVELQQSAPCSRPIEMHYSFDYAQQVHLPSNPLQPGTI